MRHSDDSKVRARGRGADSNAVGRFEPYTREAVDDGWDRGDDLPPLRTEVREERPRRVVSRNTSPDLSFDRSINPYRGCEHGCIYCYARPSHAYLGMSAGLDFETRLIARPQAPDLLAHELSARGYQPAPLAIGTNTDPYQPIERDYLIMRRCLEVLRDFRHPVVVTTKGQLIERDIDILADMAAAGLVQVGIGVTTLQPELARRMEPRVPSPQRRLKMIERLSAAGIPVRVMASPLVPGLTDAELENILAAGCTAGATLASWILLRLPFEVSTLFQQWLSQHYPDRAGRVMARVRETHGGKTYDPAWSKRMRGEGVYAQLIHQRYKLACRRLGLNRSVPTLRCDLFQVPPRPGDQLELF